MGKKVNCHGCEAHFPVGTGVVCCVGTRVHTRVCMHLCFRGCECICPESKWGCLAPEILPIRKTPLLRYKG